MFGSKAFRIGQLEAEVAALKEELADRSLQVIRLRAKKSKAEEVIKILSGKLRAIKGVVKARKVVRKKP